MAQKWFCIQNFCMDLSFQKKKNYLEIRYLVAEILSETRGSFFLGNPVYRVYLWHIICISWATLGQILGSINSSTSKQVVCCNLRRRVGYYRSLSNHVGISWNLRAPQRNVIVIIFLKPNVILRIKLSITLSNCKLFFISLFIN